jgi:hypothetical protein
MTTNPVRSRWSTSRWVTISAMISSAFVDAHAALNPEREGERVRQVNSDASVMQSVPSGVRRR